MQEQQFRPGAGPPVGDPKPVDLDVVELDYWNLSTQLCILSVFGWTRWMHSSRRSACR